MSSQANGVLGSPIDSQAGPAMLSATRPFYWSVRRELWENRSIYIGPLAVAGVALLAYVIVDLGRALASPNMEQRVAVLAEPHEFAAALPMLAAMLVGAFYCLDAFYSERRDRSILFWKSLPVSDLTTGLAKASIPFVVLPLITCVVMVAVELIMTLLSTMVVAGSGMSVAAFLARVSPVDVMVGLVYHMITVHVLWHAPFYAWMILVSSLVRRAALVWAVLPPLAIGVFEKVAFHTTYFANFVLYRMEGGPEAVPMPGHHALDIGMRLTPGHFLITPGLWLGLAFTALCVLGAVRMRRYRGPI